MTSSARGDIATARLRPRCVALITSDVGIDSSRDGKSHAAATGLVTGVAANSTHTHVTRVIKFHAEASQRRKWLETALLYIRMANSADGAAGIGKLLRMATRTGQVAAAPGPNRLR